MILPLTQRGLVNMSSYNMTKLIRTYGGWGLKIEGDCNASTVKICLYEKLMLAVRSTGHSDRSRKDGN